MGYDLEPIKNLNLKAIRDLNNISVTTQEAGLGDLIINIVESLEGSKPYTAETSETVEKKAPNVPNSKATTIRELVSDYNKLLTALKQSGIMESDIEEDTV